MSFTQSPRITVICRWSTTFKVPKIHNWIYLQPLLTSSFSSSMSFPSLPLSHPSVTPIHYPRPSNFPQFAAFPLHKYSSSTSSFFFPSFLTQHLHLKKKSFCYWFDHVVEHRSYLVRPSSKLWDDSFPYYSRSSFLSCSLPHTLFLRDKFWSRLAALTQRDSSISLGLFSSKTSVDLVDSFSWDRLSVRAHGYSPTVALPA